MFGFKSLRQREHEQLLRTMQAMQVIMKLQAKAINSMLKGFEVSEPPQARVMNDSAMWKLEQEQLEAQQGGFQPAMPAPGYYSLSAD